MAEEKSHKPSQKKKDKARKDGKVLRSQVATQALVFSLVCLGINVIAGGFSEHFSELASLCWLKSSQNYQNCLSMSGALIFRVAAVILFISAIAGFGFEIFLIGWKPELSHLLPKADRFNVVAGFKKIFNWKELNQVFIKVAIFLFITLIFFKNAFNVLLQSFTLNIELLRQNVSSLFGNCLMLINLAWVSLAVYDYWRNRKKYYQELSMSDDELRKEHKDSEGDPLIKSHRKFLHEELLMSDVVKRIKKANVIIVEKA